jgi:hypothetical protein
MVDFEKSINLDNIYFVNLILNKMKNIIYKILITMLVGSPLTSISQVAFQPGQIWIIVHDSTIIPTEGATSKNVAFQQILNNFNITNISQPMSFAKSPELRRLFQLNTTLSEDSLFNALTSINELFLSIEKCPIAENLYDPTDYMWWLTNNDPTGDWLWYLKRIQANLAWDITKGSTNVKVAVIDSGVDKDHPDFVGKISPTYDFYTGAPFSTNVNQQIHGTTVASLLAAETVDQGQTSLGQMASVGYNTQIMFSSNYSVASCLMASTVLNANIISISWYFGCSPSTSWLLAEKEILDNGTCIIRAAGNGPQCGGIRLYPFSGYEDDRTIVISSTGRDDKHIATDFLPNFQSNSHYPEVDLCAPGYTILCAVPSEGGANSWPYASFGGTSQSTPIVAGTAALMYAVNPCLTSSLVQDILKNTTDPIADAQNFPGVVGTGRLNAYKAVKAAQGSYSQNLDLYIKDRPEDFGNEINPYQWTWDIDESPDIWVRNQNDGLINQIHQDPEYQSTTPVFIYVRVRNKSCTPSIGTEKVYLHWTKASSLTSWPQNWDGSNPNIGNVVGSNTIGVLEPGEDTILVFTWTILNPYINQNWATCLLARIVNSATDIITVHPNHAELDVYLNNNIALRNVTIIDIAPGIAEPIGNVNGIYYPNGRYIYLGNPNSSANDYNFTFASGKNESLTQYAEIKLIFDDAGWNIVQDKFLENQNFKVIQPKEVILLNDSCFINDLHFPANTRIPVFVGFSFYSDYEQVEKRFKFDVRQLSLTNDIVFGGEHFTINKYIRNPFSADAGGDKTINYGENVSVNAVQISENAIYNWYDEDGNLIYTGKDMTISPEISKKYKLELIAISDGSIAIDEVEIKVNKNFIVSMSPNPASNFVTVDYILDSISSAYLMIINQTGTSFNNYIINSNSTESTINLDNFQSGLYTVVLICDGVAKDAKQLIIN